MIFFCLQTLDSFPFVFLFSIRKNKFLVDSCILYAVSNFS